MITEFRRLVFSSSELESAIRDFNKEKVEKLPVGDIVGIEIIGEPYICARIRVGNFYDNSEEQEVMIDQTL